MDQTKRERLLRLATRCEQASGQDRELDAAIAALLRIGQNLPDWAHRWGGEWRPTIQGSVVLMQDDGRPGPHFESANYTASLDAAMTLVPDKHTCIIQHTSNYEQAGHTGDRLPEWNAAVAPDNWKNPQFIYQHGWAATPALALCAASLRALATDQESGG